MYRPAVSAPAGELHYNPYAFAVHDDPYVLYRRLRDEAPAYWNPELEFWVLSRFDDVQAAFRDHETFSSAGGVALESRRPATAADSPTRMLIEMDPPDHTSFRRLVSRMFTGQRVATMEAQVRAIATGYLDRVVGRGACDLVDDFSGPLPMDVIAEVLGIPEPDRAALRSLADQLLEREDGSMDLPPQAIEGMFGLVEYFADALRTRATDADGLIADLVGFEVDGRSLTEPELLGFCVLFVIAGHETTTKLVANAVEVLSRHPDQRDAIVADPGLIPQVIEEVLRFHSSTQYMHRTATRDVEIHDRTIRSGDSVLLLIGAANHDDREFGPTADEFDIFRTAERHLAFGYGAHFCMGAALARLEGRVALEEIHRRIPDFAVDHDAKVRFHSSNVTGWTRLPLTFTPQP